MCNARLHMSPSIGIPLVSSVSSSVVDHPMSISGCATVCTNTRGGLSVTNIAIVVIGSSVLNGTPHRVPAVLSCHARMRGNDVFGAPPMIPVCALVRGLH